MMARPKRREQEIEATKGRILDAAAEVFAERGYADASMQKIAARAGYSAPSLYSYFESKEMILESLGRRMRARARRLSAMTLPADLTLRQSLELLLRAQFRFVSEHRADFSYLLNANAPAMMDEEHLEAEAEMLQDLVHFMEEHGEPSELGTMDVPYAAFLLQALAHAHFFRWVAHGAEGDLETCVPTLLELFFHGVLGASKEPISG